MEIKIETPAELPKDFYVYLHRKATSGEVFYVGKGKADRAWRTEGRGRHWFNTARKHGLIVEIASDGLQEWFAHELERDLIARHGRRDLGYGTLVNLTDGGDGVAGRIVSEETVRKISHGVSLLHKSSDWREKYLAGLSRRDNGQWKENQAEAMRKLAKDPAWREANAAKNKEMANDPEWLAKTKASSQRLSKDPVWLAKMSAKNKLLASDEEWRRKSRTATRTALAKVVIAVEADIVFEAGSDAEVWLRQNGYPKACRSKISLAATGRRKTAYGYTWRYV